MAVFKANIRNREKVHSFISALHMNQQIKKLRVALSFGDCNDLIFSTISELLPELVSLEICLHDYEPKNDVQAAIPNYRFKKLQSLLFEGACDELYSSFMFYDIKELYFCDLKKENVTAMNLARNMKKLKKLTFTCACNCIEYHRILLTELPELELIIVKCSTLNEKKILTQILATKWTIISICNSHNPNYFDTISNLLS